MKPKVIIHAGAGGPLSSHSIKGEIRESLHTIVKKTHEKLCTGSSALEVALFGCKLLEDDEHFNSGVGSVLQKDGVARMSAGLMCGKQQKFSGVINITGVKNPILLPFLLQQKPYVDRTLSESGAQILAEELNIPKSDYINQYRLNEWKEQETSPSNFASLVTPYCDENNSRLGTTGIVVLDMNGDLAAATSTGGKGRDYISRVSDSATVAGTYANQHAAVSCTGIGEDIIDEALATRLVIRVTDGLKLRESFQISFSEAKSRDRYFGAIGIDRYGEIIWEYTTENMLVAYHDERMIQDSLDKLIFTEI